MMRGAGVAIVIAGVAVAGVVIADRAGDDGETQATMPSAAPPSTLVVHVPTTLGAPGEVIVTNPAPPKPGDSAPEVDTAVPVTSAAAATTVLPATTLPATPTVPTATETSGVPAVDAAAYAVLDVTNGRWLAESAADERRPVASLMKLLTTYVVMQAGDPERVVTVPALQLDPMESAIGLYEGERLSRAVLLRAMMIVSANDAARALALDVGGSPEGFVAMMNDAAASLGLTSTHAVNAIGLDAEGAMSSARDMASLSAVLMSDETFRATAARVSASLHGQTFPATNDAFLTSYPGADGVKTGHTTNAGWCLAASATRDGRRLIAVVLGSSGDSARTAAVSALLDWGFAQG